MSRGERGIWKVPAIHRSRSALWLRILLAAALVVAWGVLGTLIVLALTPEDGPRWVRAAILGVVLLALTVVTRTAARPSFTVSSRGIIARSALRTRRVRWRDMDAVLIDRTPLDHGAAIITTRDGRRIRARFTACRLCWRRGDARQHTGQDFSRPTIPTREAIRGFERYLRGEFGRG